MQRVRRQGGRERGGEDEREEREEKKEMEREEDREKERAVGVRLDLGDCKKGSYGPCDLTKTKTTLQVHLQIEVLQDTRNNLMNSYTFA